MCEKCCDNGSFNIHWAAMRVFLSCFVYTSWNNIITLIMQIQLISNIVHHMIYRFSTYCAPKNMGHTSVHVYHKILNACEATETEHWHVCRYFMFLLMCCTVSTYLHYSWSPFIFFLRVEIVDLDLPGMFVFQERSKDYYYLSHVMLCSIIREFNLVNIWIILKTLVVGEDPFGTSPLTVRSFLTVFNTSPSATTTPPVKTANTSRSLSWQMLTFIYIPEECK